MTPEKIDALSLVCGLAVWLVLLTGVTVGLVLAFQFQRKRGGSLLPAPGDLRARPFTLIHAVPVILLTGLSALLGAFQSSEGVEKVIPPKILIAGMSFQNAAALAIAAVCALLARKRPRALFGSSSCAWGAAVGKGLLYGLAAIPVVSLVLLVVSAACDALGLDTKPQEVFNWLSDPSFPAAARATLICFIVIAAPVTEELLFRGILLPALMKGRTFAFAVLLSGFYFSLIHLHGPSFLSLMLLSAMFSAGYAATGSILTPITMHMVFNATGMLFFFASGG